MAADHQTNPDRLLRLKDVVQQLSLHHATLYRWIKAGQFPAPYRFGKRCVRWSQAEIDRWKTSPRA